MVAADTTSIAMLSARRRLAPRLRRLARSARAEANLIWRLRGDWKAYVVPLWLLAVAVWYWQWPNDLIPDRIPVVGRCDDLGVCVLAAAGARLSLVRRVLRPWRRARTAGEVALAAAGWVMAPAVLRLALGRWPDRRTRRMFRGGMARHYAPLPPLLRGLALVPQTTPQLRHLLELARRDPAACGPGVALLAPARLTLVIPPHAGNPLLAWTGPDVAFLHFEKAAGTSVLHWLAEHFHPDQIDPDPYRSMPPHLLGRVGVVPRRYALVHGHYDAPGLRTLGQGRLWGTVLREPRARIVSLYQYWRGVRAEVLAADGGNYAPCLAHELDLLAFLRCEDVYLRDYIDNCYARRLTGRYWAAGLDDPLRAGDSLAVAMDALAGFGVVGVSERLDESLAVFAGKLGVGWGGAAPRANAIADNEVGDPRFRVVARGAMTPAIEAELERLTRLDRALYAYAVSRLAGDARGGRDGD